MTHLIWLPPQRMGGHMAWSSMSDAWRETQERVRALATERRSGYSAAMHHTRSVIVLFVALIALECVLFGIESNSSLTTIKNGVLLGFLFACPVLLIGGMMLIRQPWTMMVAVIYSTIALALDLATIVQEASQPSPRITFLILTLGSSLLNFLIMVLGGRCLLTFQPRARPAESHLPKLHLP